MRTSIDPWSLAAIEQNRRWLSAYALAVCGRPDVVDDLIQDVFRIAYEKRDEFQPGTDFSAWLRAIAKNCLKRHFEATRRQPLLVGDVEHEVEDAAVQSSDHLLDSEWAATRVSALRECLASLTERARRLLDGRYVQGLSANAIAAHENISEGAVHVTVFRARETLAECVKRRLAR